MKILGLIPARKGSKGIKNKNIKKIGELPLIEHTLKFVSQIQHIDKSVLSTDSEEIIEISKKYKNIEAPFVRPDILCSDSANISDVAIHALNECNLIYKTDFTHIALFQPTSPFRKLNEITDAVDMLIKNNIDSIFSVNAVIHHPSEYITINEKGFDLVLPPKSKDEQRQLYDDVYFINGSFYMCSAEFLRLNKSFLTESSKPVIFSKYSSFDIDDEFDLELARGNIEKNEEKY